MLADITNFWFFVQRHRTDYFIHFSVLERENVREMSKLSSSSTSTVLVFNLWHLLPRALHHAVPSLTVRRRHHVQCRAAPSSPVRPRAPGQVPVPRSRPRAPVPTVRHGRTPSPAAAYPRPCPRPWPRPHPPQEEKTGRRRSHAVPAGEGGPGSPTDEDRVELFRAPTLAAARRKASARLMPFERAPPHAPTSAPPDL